MASYLLIHGAFRGAWMWDRLIRELRSLGHRGIAVELPNAGSKWREDHPQVSMTDYTDAVLQAAKTMADPILVGHSQGGVVARVAAERSPESFSAIAYLDAPIPEDGLRAIDLQPPSWEDRTIPELGPDVLVPPLPLEPGPDLSAEDAEWMNAMVTPQPVLPSLETLHFADEDAAALPTHVAFCSATPEIYPCWRTRSAMDTAGEPYTLLDGPHDIAVTDPVAVAGWLSSVIQPVE